MTAIAVRPAIAADVPALLAMIRELAAHQNELVHVQSSEASLLRDGFGDAAKFHALIAEVGGAPAGYLTYTLPYTIWGARRYVNVDDVFVRAAFRSRGVGAALLAPVKALVTEMQSYARWSVQPANRRAIEFYRAQGARYVERGFCYWQPPAA